MLGITVLHSFGQRLNPDLTRFFREIVPRHHSLRAAHGIASSARSVPTFGQ